MSPAVVSCPGGAVAVPVAGPVAAADGPAAAVAAALADSAVVVLAGEEAADPGKVLGFEC